MQYNIMIVLDCVLIVSVGLSYKFCTLLSFVTIVIVMHSRDLVNLWLM